MHFPFELRAAFILGAALQTAPQQTAQSVLDAEVAICQGYERNDAASVRRNLTDDYTLTDSKGVVTTRQDDIEDFTKHRIHYTVFRNKHMKVRLYPGVAIVTGQTVVQGTAGAAPVDIEVQFTDTLVWLHGRWMLAAGHVSRLRSGKA